ncbi:PepSY domain-containing protein [Paenibacillus dokdonensis]|uniref:PepSY domain-containing protein n=1 Tax=Paenibacillus dokdonensis TaxID=2567944 RepID=A0ABU6GWK0_9BACL|nr:PepSY domain-containing protein [Paenibacillus dokdonensis]MEC0244125.1 PepSY domain-containing protein [Paenibacillus dokdonensis]
MRKISIILLGLILLIGAAGCSSKEAEGGNNSGQASNQDSTNNGTNTGTDTSTDTENNTNTSTTAPTPSKETNPAAQASADLQKTTFKVTPREALDLAATKGQGDVTKLELELENQVYAYKVEMMTDTQKTKVGIHADDKSILENKSEPLDKSKVKIDREQSKIDLTGIIDEKKAMGIATQKVNGTVSQWKIERKNGPTYYEVDVHNANKEHEIKIDAKTGKILSLGEDD